jgi:transcriptional regulator with PAS, ATPase and Fis domain
MKPKNCMCKDCEHAKQCEEDRMEILFRVLDNENDITLTDGKGVVLRVSDSYEEHFCVGKHEVEGKTVYELEDEGVFKPSVTAAVIREKKKVTLMQKNIKGEIGISTGVPIFNDNGKIEYVISFNAIDIANMTSLYDNYLKLTELMKEYSSEINNLKMKEIKDKDFVAKSKRMSDIMQLVTQVADTTANMLITGETGVGKSMLARITHQNSLRSKKPFIEINCGTIPPTLIESELFGYEKGAFTGANREGKIGKIELANGGTLFLDDIGELPIEMQTKLLQVIQEKVIVRIGGLEKITVNFRLIAATNKDLKKAIKEGSFREDLYYRLNVISVYIPALRERKEDIAPLIYSFTKRFNKAYNRNIKIPADVMSVLENCEWPGNIRQIENMVERLVITAKSDTVSINDLPLDIEVRSAQPLPRNQDGSLKRMIDEYEKVIFLDAFEKYKTSVAVGKVLGISQTTAARKLRKYLPNYTVLREDSEEA